MSKNYYYKCLNCDVSFLNAKTDYEKREGWLGDEIEKEKGGRPTSIGHRCADGKQGVAYLQRID